MPLFVDLVRGQLEQVNCYYSHLIIRRPNVIVEQTEGQLRSVMGRELDCEGFVPHRGESSLCARVRGF